MKKFRIFCVLSTILLIHSCKTRKKIIKKINLKSNTYLTSNNFFSRGFTLLGRLNSNKTNYLEVYKLLKFHIYKKCEIKVAILDVGVKNINENLIENSHDFWQKQNLEFVKQSINKKNIFLFSHNFLQKKEYYNDMQLLNTEKPRFKIFQNFLDQKIFKLPTFFFMEIITLLKNNYFYIPKECLQEGEIKNFLKEYNLFGMSVPCLELEKYTKENYLQFVKNLNAELKKVVENIDEKNYIQIYNELDTLCKNFEKIIKLYIYKICAVCQINSVSDTTESTPEKNCKLCDDLI